MSKFKIGDKVRASIGIFEKDGPGVLVNILTDGDLRDHVVKFRKLSKRYVFAADELKKLMDCPEYFKEL